MLKGLSERPQVNWMPARLTSGLGLLVTLLFPPATANGMTLLAADLQDLVRDSHTIVRASVASVENVVLDPDGQRMEDDAAAEHTRSQRPYGLSAFTDVKLRILATYKGQTSAGGALSLRLVGGRVGHYVVAVPGMPRFFEGEEVLLFLEATAPGLTPLGASQGVFRIQRSEGEPPWAIHDLTGAAVLRRDVVPTGCTSPNQAQADGLDCTPRRGPGLPAIPSLMPLEVLDAQLRAILGLPVPPRALPSRARIRPL